MEYKREELIALMREMEKQIALCHISPQLAGAIADDLERSEPVAHGHWDEGVNNGYCCCSNCRGVYILQELLTDGKWNYCPNCGAHMKDGE